MIKSINPVTEVLTKCDLSRIELGSKVVFNIYTRCDQGEWFDPYEFVCILKHVDDDQNYTFSGGNKDLVYTPMNRKRNQLLGKIISKIDHIIDNFDQHNSTTEKFKFITNITTEFLNKFIDDVEHIDKENPDYELEVYKLIRSINQLWNEKRRLVNTERMKIMQYDTMYKLLASESLALADKKYGKIITGKDLKHDH